MCTFHVGRVSGDYVKIYVTNLIFLCNIDGLHALTTPCFCNCQAAFLVVCVNFCFGFDLDECSHRYNPQGRYLSDCE